MGKCNTYNYSKYDIRYDRNGFRNDVDYRKADCIVIGDSFVEGTEVSSDELLTSRIADTLGITVVNLGQSGYGPQQEFKVLERFGVPLQPRICVWVFYEGNDLGDVRRYQEFTNDWPNLVSEYSSWKKRFFTRNAFVWLSKKLTPAPPLSESPGLSRPPDFSGVIQTNDGAKRLWFGHGGSELSELSAWEIEALQVTTATLADAHAMCHEQGIELAVVFAPTKFRVYADVCQFDEGSPIRKWYVNDLPQRLSDAVAGISGDIRFLDLTPEFKKSAENGSILYYADDEHWSPKGHDLAACTICELLRTNYRHSLQQAANRQDGIGDD